MYNVMVGWLTVKDKTCVTYVKIRPLYKVRMCQDQAHTRANDTYGTITQHLSFQKKIKQSYSLSIFLCSNSALSYILHQSSIAYQSSNYLEAILSNAFNEGFIDLLVLVLMFSSSGSLTTEDFCGDGTGSSGTKCSRLRRISFVGVSIM